MKSLNKGLVIGFAAAVLGALAVAPRPGYGADDGRGTTTSNNTDGMTEAEKQAYRDSYNRAFQQAREDEQKRIDEEGEESQSGCCG